jgi:DNA-binding CsgD family transcriptional regulator
MMKGGTSLEAGMKRSTGVFDFAERIFNATITPTGCASALEALTDLLDADHAIILASEAGSGKVIFADCARIDEERFRRFLSPEAVTWMESFRQAIPEGTVVTWSHVAPDRQFERSEFYNEVMRLVNGFYAVVSRQEFPAFSAFLAICRPRQQGDFSSSDCKTLQRLLPCLATSLELQYRLHVSEQQRAGFADILNKLEAGVIVTDAAARAIFVNREAARIIAAKDGLHTEPAPLAASTPSATRRLHQAIAAMAADVMPEGQRLRLERPSGRPPLLLTVQPIARLGAALPGASAPRVAIFINELDEPRAIDRAALADGFELTPRESEVAARLAGGSDLATIAAALRMSYSTVRTHLLHIFEKTGVHNQAALVSLLVRMAELQT